MVVLIEMMTIGSWVSRQNRLSPQSYILSPAVDSSSPYAKLSFKCWRFCNTWGVYSNGLLTHCTTPNLADQGTYFSLVSTPQTCSAWLDLPGVQDSHWSGGYWGTQAITPLQGTCTRWWWIFIIQDKMRLITPASLIIIPHSIKSN